ncbi:MAG: saccharopine dehydrogenase NADP-binding domain-containing protein [Planctomycetes bacterium]|nr:saccharopine dehydrogenase NADP-binding domain-containing protein [Planctomycetota bacterium]
MKKILVVGAGQSAPYLIHYLLEHAEGEDWQVTVADLDLEAARARVGGHERGRAISFDVNDTEQRTAEIRAADLVVSMMPPAFHRMIAHDCVEIGRHLVTASYRDAYLRDLDPSARRKGVLILSEMGMDPGIDHMSAMALIEKVRAAGGRIVGFRSYGSGLPAPDSVANPFKYVITWNPRNVVIAGQYGAQYMEDGQMKIIPYHEVFQHTWDAEVEGVGPLEAYPNRDSLSYMHSFGLEDVTTMIRGTLRYRGWCETWLPIVLAGFTNDTVEIPNLGRYSYREVAEMFLPLTTRGSIVEQRLAVWLNISPTGHILDNLRWLGLFSDEKVRCRGKTAADVVTSLLVERLKMPPGGRDMAILQHELEVVHPARGDAREKLISTLITYGEPGGFTAMSKTVGLPAAIGVKLILQGKIDLRGCLLPTEPTIYRPVLAELAAHGLAFRERSSPL